MEHVYLLTNTFLDLIQRDDVLPKGINTSMIISAVGEGPTACLQFLKLHWQDFLLQYIGVLTTGIFGLLLAIFLPLIGIIICYELNMRLEGCVGKACMQSRPNYSAWCHV